jgi:glycosyltransferase involved in cell wall biosynthesis
MGKQVLLVGPVPPPTGGIATHVASLARALGVAGIGATVVDPRGRLRFVTELGRAGLAGEVVHLHVCGHNRSSYGLLGACLAATPRLPAMVTLHSGLLPGYLDGVSATGRRTIAGLLARAARVVVVSPAIAAAVRDLGVDDVAVISPFIAAGLTPGRPPVRVAAAREAGATLVVAAMARGLEYGAAILAQGFARVAAQLPEAVLVVFGPGGADRDVARRLDERGLGDRVIALGELDPRTALATLEAADVVVRPTLADGDAVTVREARALGARVVASDAAARPPGTTLFATGDARALADAILAALRAPPPPPSLDDGFARLAALYATLGTEPYSTLPVVGHA